MASDPTHQFQIKNLLTLGHIGDFPIAFTNSALFMIVAVTIVSAVMLIGARKKTLVPGRMQSMAEVSYEFIADMIRSTTGPDGMRFFPFVFCLFFFVLACNMLGLVPYFFTVTSHIVVTMALALLVMAVVIGYGILNHGIKFFALFLPSGLPWALRPLMLIIEIMSFLSRPVSLSMRLFGNMLGGHIALKVIAGFIIALATSDFFLIKLISPLPVALTIALTALEILVSMLQAYVFAILTCVYLNDALHPAH